MKKCSVFIGCLLWLIPSIGIFAIMPPSINSYQSGWGMNPTQWETRSGGFSEWGIFDPNFCGNSATGNLSGEWLTVCKPIQKNRLHEDSQSPTALGTLRTINHAPITLELWVETYMILTYECTGYQWHRLGDATETIAFIIQGNTQINTEIQITLAPGSNPLTHLKFVEDIFGNSALDDSWDLQIAWSGRWGNGNVIGDDVQWGWESVTPQAGSGCLCISAIPPCDHWFQFQGTFTIPYHQPDGYYRLVVNGCPALVM